MSICITLNCDGKCDAIHSFDQFKPSECPDGLGCANRLCLKSHPVQTREELWRIAMFSAREELKKKLRSDFVSWCAKFETDVSKFDLTPILSRPGSYANKTMKNQQFDRPEKKRFVPKKTVSANYRTRPCPHIIETGRCERNEQGKCSFAHTPEQLRDNGIRCRFNENCYRDDCYYQHDNETAQELFQRLTALYQVKEPVSEEEIEEESEESEEN